MSFSRSLLRSAILLAVVIAAGCDRDVDSVTAPAKMPSRPNALIVPMGYSDVSVGSQYACAIRAGDSTLVCWGDNEFGKSTPPAGKYTQVSVGIDHACAVRADYRAVCWGDASSGGNAPPTFVFSQVSVGRQYGCGVRLDNRSVVCWGSNQYGKTTPPGFPFSQVSTSEYHACGLGFSDGRVMCWGFNNAGQANSPTGAFTQIDAGRNYTCAVRSDGRVLCWGVNDVGQSLPLAGAYTQVSAAYTHSCAIRTVDRGIACWGDPRDGMLSAPAGAYVKVSAGYTNSCAIRAGDNLLVCWGQNKKGESVPPGSSPGHVAPTATFGASARVTALDTIRLTLTGAQVPGYPNATAFKAQFDCGGGLGYGLVTTASTAACVASVAGTRVVRAKIIDQDGDATTYSKTVIVDPRPQTVTFTSTVPNASILGTTYTVSAAASSGLPVRFTTSSSAICSINGSVVAFVGMGTCTITATQDGNTVYAVARASQSFATNYPFSGFYLPVRNQPTINTMTAGRYVKIVFSLGGNRGGNVVAYTTPYTGTCSPTATYSPVASTTTGTSGLVEYDAMTQRYSLTWYAVPALAGSCRLVTVTFADGTSRALKFKFN